MRMTLTWPTPGEIRAEPSTNSETACGANDPAGISMGIRSGGFIGIGPSGRATPAVLYLLVSRRTVAVPGRPYATGTVGGCLRRGAADTYLVVAQAVAFPGRAQQTGNGPTAQVDRKYNGAAPTAG